MNMLKKLVYEAVQKYLEKEASTAGGITGHQSPAEPILPKDKSKMKYLAKEVSECINKLAKEGLLKEGREMLVSPKSKMYGIPLKAYLTFSVEDNNKSLYFYLPGSDIHQSGGWGEDAETRRDAIKILQEILQLLEDIGTIKSAAGMWDIVKRQAEGDGWVEIQDLNLSRETINDLLNRAGFLSRPDTEEERTNFLLKHGEMPSDEEWKQGIGQLGHMVRRQ